MKAIILNSGLGSRLGDLTRTLPKCLLEIGGNQTILGRQMSFLEESGINDIFITTGHGADQIKHFLRAYYPQMRVQYIHNNRYAETNNIYSLFLVQREFIKDPSSVILFHGDLVFDKTVLQKLVDCSSPNTMIANYSYANDKDFTGRIKAGIINKIGVGLSGEGCCFVAPFYKLSSASFLLWLKKMEEKVLNGAVKVYAEEALAEIYNQVNLVPVDTSGLFCQEIDDEGDLLTVRKYLAKKSNSSKLLLLP